MHNNQKTQEKPRSAFHEEMQRMHEVRQKMREAANQCKSETASANTPCVSIDINQAHQRQLDMIQVKKAQAEQRMARMHSALHLDSIKANVTEDSLVMA